MFFCKGALETVKKLGWSPDVVHCHGWFTAMVPAFLKTTYKDDPAFKDAKVMYSLYADEDFDTLTPKYAEMAGQEDMTPEEAAVYGDGSYVDLYKGALTYTDIAVYADETIDPTLKAFIAEKGIRSFSPKGDDDYEGFGELFDEFATVDAETA